MVIVLLWLWWAYGNKLTELQRQYTAKFFVFWYYRVQKIHTTHNCFMCVSVFFLGWIYNLDITSGEIFSESTVHWNSYRWSINDGNLLLRLRHNCNVQIYLSDKMVTGDTLWIGTLHVYRKKEALVFDFFCSSLLRSGCRNM